MINGEKWDNNRGVDYRLWIGFDALDAHLHVSGRGAGALGLNALKTAMASAGIVAGVSSWIENHALDGVDTAHSRLFRLRLDTSRRNRSQTMFGSVWPMERSGSSFTLR